MFRDWDQTALCLCH